MPSLHIVGEITGAALDGPNKKKASTLRRLFDDLLSLEPSSGMKFFCKWQVVPDVEKFLSQQFMSNSSSSKEGSNMKIPKGNFSNWKCLQGSLYGQTQIHALGETNSSLLHTNRTLGLTTNDEEEEEEEIDVIWAHVVDLHLASKSIDGWPRFFFEIWSEDSVGNKQIYGYSSCLIPMQTSQEFVLDIPIWKPIPIGLYDQLTSYFGLPTSSPASSITDTSNSTSKIKIHDAVECGMNLCYLETETRGTLYLRFSILHEGFELDSSLSSYQPPASIG